MRKAVLEDTPAWHDSENERALRCPRALEARRILLQHAGTRERLTCACHPLFQVFLARRPVDAETRSRCCNMEYLLPLMLDPA